jgi:tripartite-type tricarboxylate transporter receptor subunit TctC
MGVLPFAAAKGMLEGGKLWALATASEERSELLPMVPTTAEAGYPDAIVFSWYGLRSPPVHLPRSFRPLPRPHGQPLLDPDVQATATTAGGEIGFLGTDDFIQLLNRDRERWERYAPDD